MQTESTNAARKACRHLKWATLRSIAASMKRSRRAANGGSSHRTAVIVTPASPGGLGDDALVTSLANAARDRGFNRLLLATHAIDDDWKLPRTWNTASTPLPRKHLLSWTKFLRSIRHAEATMIIGADMLDGHYGSGPSLTLLQVADLSARMGLTSIVIGASFNGEAPASVTSCIRDLSPDVHLLARDPISKSRFDTIRRLPTPLVADIAFLLQPTPAEASPLVARVAAWIQQRRAAGSQLVLGCNVNPYPFARAGKSTAEFLQRHVETLTALHESQGPLSVIFISHDRREPYNDVRSLTELSRLLPAGIATNTQLLETEGSAAEMKAIASRCDLLLTGRMHLAIASLGSGVPLGCIGYQGKCEGLFQHFGLTGMVLPNEQALEPGRMRTWFSAIAEQRAALKATIATHLPRVIELSRMNLKQVRDPSAC